MDELVLVCQWLEGIFTEEEISEPALLVWDSFHALTESDLVKNTLQSLNVHTAVIPGGCTSKLQILDVCINHPFKVYLEEAFDSFMENSTKHTFTKAGTMRAPTKIQLCDMVVNS